MKKLEIPGWDQYFMTLAYFVAMRSKDTSTHIGAVIVGPDNEVRSMGYNSFVRGIDDYNEERHERPEKYYWFEHGERNAIYNAARMGMRLAGCRMYTQGTPCADCARAVIQSGITEVIVHKFWEDGDNDPNAADIRKRWTKEAYRSKEMFDEAGVQLRIYDGLIVSEITGLASGELITFSNLV